MLDGEWSIIGGTQAFYNACGYIKYKEVVRTVGSIITDIVRELDVHIFTPETSTAVCDSSWDQPALNDLSYNSKCLIGDHMFTIHYVEAYSINNVFYMTVAV